MTMIAYLAFLVALLGIVALAYLFGRIDQRKYDELYIHRLLAELAWYERQVR